MRIKDALSAMQAEKRAEKQEKKREHHRLTTRWTEQMQPGETPDEYPRPQLCRKEWMCLNGYWHYAITETGGRPDVFDGKILVPFSPESERSGVNRTPGSGQYLWYFRTVMLSRIPEGKRLLLHFGGVDERCIVWWNGKLVLSHRNGYLPFSCDVTEQVRQGKNTIWLRVQDDTEIDSQCTGKQSRNPGGMFYTAQSGIWQTVWLEWVPEHYIEKIRMTPDLDRREVCLEVFLSGPEDVEITVRGELTSYTHFIPAADFRIQKAEKTNADHTLEEYVWASAVMSLPEIHPWSPEDPFLYDISIQAGEDQAVSYFALRKYSVGRDPAGKLRLMLNNRPYFFDGVLDQGYWPESLYTPPGDEAMITDIQNMKKLGFRMIRKHLKIEPMRWYYHCDRLGMVVWQDMVNGGGSVNLMNMCYLPNAFPMLTSRIKDNRYPFFGRKDRTAREQWEADCLSMVSQLYNCPCISLWVLFNEGWGQFDALRITERIRERDQTRMIDHASGWYDQGGGDVKSVHNYFRRLQVKPDSRPYVISEYGGLTCPAPGHIYTGTVYGHRHYPDTHRLSSGFWKMKNKIYRLEKKGLSAAVYTQLSDVEEEMNGIYTYDRKVCKVECHDEKDEKLKQFSNN